MPETVIDAQVAELDAALAGFKPQVEGLLDFARLDLSVQAKESIQAALSVYQERLLRLETSVQALRSLRTHGYPGPLTREVAASVFAELRTNRETIEAAFSQFQAETEAVAVRVDFTDPS